MTATASDVATIRAALDLLGAPGEVRETRIPKAGRYKTVSGCYDDLDAQARDAAEWSGLAAGVYVTVNPIAPALLARSPNRLTRYAEHTTNDADIVRRRWLPVDFDPRRPAGISSSDEEHAAALDRARSCGRALVKRGLPHPVLADSANGGHLLLPIDLPSEDGGLVQRVLQTLGLEWDDDLVAVDQTSYNAGRIWKAYGTKACKGADTPERPHRYARLLYVPKTLRVATREQLEALARDVPLILGRATSPNGSGALDVPAWLARHGLAVRRSAPWQGGQKWVLEVCPLNPDHADDSAVVIQFPSGALSFRCHHNGCVGKDWHALRDQVEPGWRERGQGHRATAAASRGGEDNDGRPVIDVAEQELTRLADESWTAVARANDPPRLFLYGGSPVRIGCNADDGAPVLRPLDEDALGVEADGAARFVKTSERSGRAPVFPPLRVVRAMLAVPDLPLPVLRAITEAPTFAPDGSLPAGPGYHEPSRTYYAPAPGFVVPPVRDTPTREQVEAARELLIGQLLCDFPFIGAAELAHAVGLLLLPFARGLIDGPTPLHLIEKPAAGTGASLLVDLVATIVTGRPAAGMTAARDEDEMRKRITARLLGAPAILLIDNVRDTLDSAALSSALTTTMWGDRLLGKSEHLSIPNRCAWACTGNNPQMSGEIARRTVRCRMDAKQDRPWDRRGFKHDPILDWVREHRGELVAACLTLGRAWLAAGRPVPAGLRPLGSFESWSRVIGGILHVAGIPGFLGNVEEFHARSDSEGEGIRLFLGLWWDEHATSSVGVASLYSLASKPECGIDLGGKGENSERVRLGKLLRSLRDRVYRLEPELTVRVDADGSHQGVQRWRLTRSEPQAPDPVETEESGGGGGGGGGYASVLYSRAGDKSPNDTHNAIGTVAAPPPPPPPPPTTLPADCLAVGVCPRLGLCPNAQRGESCVSQAPAVAPAGADDRESGGDR